VNSKLRIRLFVLIQCTYVTDSRTDRWTDRDPNDGTGRAYA